MLKEKKVAVLGFGKPGTRHALNLKDSGMNVCVGLRKLSAHGKSKESRIRCKDYCKATEGQRNYDTFAGPEIKKCL